MESEHSKKKLEKLIAEGREEEAIEAVVEVADFQKREVRALILLTSNKFKKLQHKQRLGIISKENANIISAEINSNLLEILDEIIWEKPDPEAGSNAQQEKPTRKRLAVILTTVSLVVLAAIVVLSASLNIFNTQEQTQTTGKVENPLSLWAGEWKQELQSREEQPVKGKLQFQIENGNSLTGTALNLPLNGVDYKTELFNISASEKGRVLSGYWKAVEPEVRQWQGTFWFELETKNKFSGHYTINNQSGRFYWRGKR